MGFPVEVMRSLKFSFIVDLLSFAQLFCACIKWAAGFAVTSGRFRLAVAFSAGGEGVGRSPELPAQPAHAVCGSSTMRRQCCVSHAARERR
jgi:hypothetical protein